MRTSDFDYHLPPEFIAQTPIEPRDAARLLVLHRARGVIEHRTFREIGAYLQPGDLLVLNRTRVLPARLFARKPSGGRVEILLLRQHDALTWEALIGGKHVRQGTFLKLETDPQGEWPEAIPKVEVIAEGNGAERLIRFSQPVEPYLPRLGHVPLPPYIHEPLRDPERYQTVYATEPGSAAAPTAGLHFTQRLLDELQAQGVQIAYVTLHVGLDTFAPVTVENPRAHKIHTEWCSLPPETAAAIQRARGDGKRVIAVGTTTVRTLESAAQNAAITDRNAPVPPYCGNTSLYIIPGYQFKIVDAMITNFHLPRSTLLMLVSAFAGRETILRAYQIAMQEGYRFYSFGDAMFIC